LAGSSPWLWPLDPPLAAITKYRLNGTFRQRVYRVRCEGFPTGDTTIDLAEFMSQKGPSSHRAAKGIISEERS
jgi:hypothetical protein